MSDEKEYVPLKGEGDVQYIKRTRSRHDCDVCGEPADFRISFLLENARSNPASSGYRGDDISWCSDAERYVCAEHREERSAPNGYRWCSTCDLSKFPHMGLYDRDEKITLEDV